MSARVLSSVLALALLASPAAADEPEPAAPENPAAPAKPAVGAQPAAGASAAAEPAMSAEEKAMAEAWEKSRTPGPQHAALQPMVGTFHHVMKSWMEPGAPPMESTGTTEFRWILGGRYLEQEFKGTFMGEPFEGQGHYAFDNVKKKYLITWMDVTSTGILFMEGTADETGKVITTTGDMTDPMGNTSAFRTVTRIEGPDRHVFEMWTSDPARPNESKMMEITYTRAK